MVAQLKRPPIAAVEEVVESRLVQLLWALGDEVRVHVRPSKLALARCAVDDGQSLPDLLFRPVGGDLDIERHGNPGLNVPPRRLRRGLRYTVLTGAVRLRPSRLV